MRENKKVEHKTFVTQGECGGQGTREGVSGKGGGCRERMKRGSGMEDQVESPRDGDPHSRRTSRRFR